MSGNFAYPSTPEEKAKINHITRWYKLPFYKHVENMLEKGETEEYIPLREYLLRHDKVRVLYFRIMENRVILRQFIVKKLILNDYRVALFSLEGCLLCCGYFAEHYEKILTINEFI